MRPTRCPTCDQPVQPVYCAASTLARPLMLAWTARQAARVLGANRQALFRRLHRWRDGWRLGPRRDAVTSAEHEARSA